MYNIIRQMYTRETKFSMYTRETENLNDQMWLSRVFNQGQHRTNTIKM
jgi:hypothetical protein